GENQAAERRFRAALTAAERLDNESLVLDPKLNLASLLAHTGRIGEAAALASDVLAIARERGSHGHEIMARILLADGEYQAGRLSEAIADYEAAVDLGASVGASDEQRFWNLDYLTEALDCASEARRALEA